VSEKTFTFLFRRFMWTTSSAIECSCRRRAVYKMGRQDRIRGFCQCPESRKQTRLGMNLTQLAFAVSDISWAGFNKTIGPRANNQFYAVFIIAFSFKGV